MVSGLHAAGQSVFCNSLAAQQPYVAREKCCIMATERGGELRPEVVMPCLAMYAVLMQQCVWCLVGFI